MRAVRMARDPKEHGFIVVFEDATVAVLDPEALVTDYHTANVRGEVEITETHYLPPDGGPLVARVNVAVRRNHLEVTDESGTLVAEVPGGFYGWPGR